MTPPPGETGETGELSKALSALAQAYIPRADAVKPSTYADWWPRDPRWPAPLAELHAACVEARRALVRAYSARKQANGADAAVWGAAVTLQAIAYYALESEARAAIIAWLRDWIERHESEGEGEGGPQ